MTNVANPLRGEATFMISGRPAILRPTFAALVAAEEELGSLYSLVERAADGGLRLQELASLFWHCLADRAETSREEVGEAIIAQGLAASSKPLKTLLRQILQGIE